jgi:hypothetical protein
MSTVIRNGVLQKQVKKLVKENIEDNKEMFDWLIENVSKKMEGEKLKALHHPFDTQMNEAMNNAVARRCPKTKMFAGSQSLLY